MTKKDNLENSAAPASLVGRLVRQHWYCFSYTDIAGSISIFASTYTGYIRKGITMQRINENKKNANVRGEAVLVSCSYLGYMTREEFTE